MRFLGNIEAKADSKGRVFLPVVFRKVLNASGEGDLVLRKDVFRDCLMLYPESVWNEQLDYLRSKLSRWNAEHQQIYRSFVADAEAISVDGSGRILISKRLMKMANIEQSVRFIGMGDYIEIWNCNDSEKPFMSSEDLGKALQSVMSDKIDF